MQLPITVTLPVRRLLLSNRISETLNSELVITVHSLTLRYIFTVDHFLMIEKEDEEHFGVAVSRHTGFLSHFRSFIVGENPASLTCNYCIQKIWILFQFNKKFCRNGCMSFFLFPSQDSRHKLRHSFAVSNI